MKLQERLDTMVDNEGKRRMKALTWLRSVTEMLEEVAVDIWGTGEEICSEKTNTISLSMLNNSGEKRIASIYFRYEDNEDGGYEPVGFYDGGYNCDMNVGGISVVDMDGKDFWHAIDIIMKWLPMLMDELDEMERFRDELISKLPREGDING